MSWTDKKSIEVIKYLRDKFKVKVFIETGTFMGVNAELHSKNFEDVQTCEIVDKYYEKATDRFEEANLDNIVVYNLSSPYFLEREVKLWNSSRKDMPFFYLDAHFYDKKLPKGKGKFVVLKELKALQKLNKDCIIMIHDFDNGLGHITYDGMPLDLKLIEKELFKINSNFHLYTNELSSCDIVKPTVASIKDAGLNFDDDTIDNLQYAWSELRLTARGILYCLPKPLSKKEMKQLGLREWY